MQDKHEIELSPYELESLYKAVKAYEEKWWEIMCLSIKQEDWPDYKVVLEARQALTNKLGDALSANKNMNDWKLSKVIGSGKLKRRKPEKA